MDKRIAALISTAAIGTGAMTFIPSVFFGNVYSEWSQLPLANLVRAGFALLTLFFLPGYFAVLIAGYKDAIMAFPVAVSASVFFGTIFAFLALTYHISLMTYPILILIGMISSYLIQRASKMKPERRLESAPMNHKLREIASNWPFGVVAIVTLALVSSIHLLPRNVFVGGDMLTDFSAAMSILRSHNPWPELSILESAVGIPSFPPYSLDFLASFLTLSGLPPLNLILLSIIPVHFVTLLSTYAFALRLFQNKVTAAIGTLAVYVFGGFLLLSIFLKSGTEISPAIFTLADRDGPNQIYDILSRTASASIPIRPLNIEPYLGLRIELIAMIAFLTLLISLRVYEHTSQTQLFFATFVSSFVAFSFHEIELFLFIVAFCLTALVLLDFFSRVIPIGILSALLFLLVLEIGSGYSFFIYRIDFWYSLGAALLLSAFTYYRKPVQIARQTVAWIASKSFVTVAFVLVVSSLYVLGVFFWVTSNLRSASWVVVPWFDYPAWLGIACLIAIAGVLIHAVLHVPAPRLIIWLLVSSLTTFAASKTIVYLGFYSSIGEYHLIFFTFLGIALTSSYFINSFRWRFWSRRLTTKILVAFVIALVFASGLSAASFSVVYSAREARLAPSFFVEQQPIIEYLYNSRPVGTLVSSPSFDRDWISNSIFIASGAYSNYLLVTEPFAQERDPLEFWNLVGSWKIGYFYAPSWDDQIMSDLNASGSYLTSAVIPTLKPVVTVRDASRLFEIPGSGMVSADSSIALVVPASGSAVRLAFQMASVLKLRPTMDTKSSYSIVDDFYNLGEPVKVISNWQAVNSSVSITNAAALLQINLNPGRESFPGSYFNPPTQNVSVTGGSFFYVDYATSSLSAEALRFYFELQDATGSVVYRSELSPSQQQRRFVMPIGSETKVRRLWFGLDTGNASVVKADLAIYGMGFAFPSSPGYAEETSLPVRNASELIQWASQGGRAIVLTDGNGPIAEGVGLTSGGTKEVSAASYNNSLISFNPMMIPVLEGGTSNLSRLISVFNSTGQSFPLALEAQIGQGALILVDISAFTLPIPSLVSLITTFLSNQQSRPFYGIKPNILNIAMDLMMNGTVNVITDTLLMKYTNSSGYTSYCKCLVPSSLIIDGQPVQITSGSGVLLFQDNPANISITTPSAVIHGAGQSYFNVEVNGSSTIILNFLHAARLEFNSNTSYTNYAATKVEITADMNNAELLVRAPLITGSGTTFSSWATIFAAQKGYADLSAASWKNNMTILGNFATQLIAGYEYMQLEGTTFHGSIVSAIQSPWWDSPRLIIKAEIDSLLGYRLFNLATALALSIACSYAIVRGRQRTGRRFLNP